MARASAARRSSAATRPGSPGSVGWGRGSAPRPVGLPGVEAAEDLVVIAAQRLKEATGYPGGARISVTKRIPHGGGLGGGSSDAATVLTALNHLWGTGLGPGELAEIGLGIGSDVPVFIHGQAAWAEGREMSVENLPNMLEGQVAALSSGVLAAVQ